MAKEDQIIEALSTVRSGIRHINRRSMRLGRYVNGVLESKVNNDLPAGYVWVFDPQGDKRVSSPAKNLKTEYGVGIAVIVAYNVDSLEDDVLDLDTLLAPLEQGSAAAGLNSPQKPASLPTPTSARDIIPGGVFADSGGGLNVRVGAYKHEGGYWADGSALALTPTATSSKKSFAVVGVNRLTNALTYTLSADRSTAITLVANGAPTTYAQTDIQAVIDADPDTDWRGAVELTHGDTSINPAKIVPLNWDRPQFVGADGSTAGVRGLVPAPAATDNVKALFGNGSYYSVIKADGTIAMTGSLNFNGQDANGVNWLNFDDSTELTIASGAITATQTFHRVDTEADAAADDLDTISGGSDGRILVLRAENGGRSVVIKHNTGNIQTYSGTDVTLNETYMPVLLVYDGTLSKWLAFGGGGAGGGVSSVVAGTNISVDNTDPANPIVSASSSPGGGAAPSICEGRITLTSSTSVTTGNVTGAGTVYYTPHIGNYIGLRNGGGSWEILTFSELSISLSGLLPHSYHDLYCYNNSGTPTLELLAWTAGATGAITGASNATPISITSTAHGLSTGDIVTITGVGGNTAANGTFRITNTGANTFTLQTLAAGGANVAGSGAYTSGGNWYKANYTPSRATAYTLQDGVKVKSGDATRRLLGTIQISATAGQTADAVGQRLVSNLINAVPRVLNVAETTDSWTYGTAAFRAVNNNWNQRVEAVFCEPRYITLDSILTASRVTGNFAGTGIGINSVTTDNSLVSLGLATGIAGLTATYSGYQSAGGAWFYQLENTNGASNTFYGDVGVNYVKTGLIGVIDN